MTSAPVAIVTGSGGLVGSEAVRHFIGAGYEVHGIDNDLRSSFFGASASTAGTMHRLSRSHDLFQGHDADIRDLDALGRIFRDVRSRLDLIVHAAAQPSHDWAASNPQTDFSVNASGTLNLLEATRRFRPEATFVFVSTNKVYGDRPNSLPLLEAETRLDLPRSHDFYLGIPRSMPIDTTMHSLFGVSKTAADLLVQEYGRYFDLPTVCFRCGCISGPGHAGAELHGFLSYLMRCAVTGTRYTIFGHGGRQVRDNIHAADLVQAFDLFHQSPRAGAVYNLGGGRESSVSILEAIELTEAIAGSRINYELSEQARRGDHRWWISDNSEFCADYPAFSIERTSKDILTEIYRENVEAWASEGSARH